MYAEGAGEGGNRPGDLLLEPLQLGQDELDVGHRGRSVPEAIRAR